MVKTLDLLSEQGFFNRSSIDTDTFYQPFRFVLGNQKR